MGKNKVVTIRGLVLQFDVLEASDDTTLQAERFIDGINKMFIEMFPEQVPMLAPDLDGMSIDVDLGNNEFYVEKK